MKGFVFMEKRREGLGGGIARIGCGFFGMTKGGTCRGKTVLDGGWRRAC